MTLCSVPASLGTAHIGASSPGVVLSPIVDSVLSFFISIEKPDISQGGNEYPIVTSPFSGELNVLDGHISEVTVASVCGSPE